MPISVDEIFREFKLRYSRPYKWNEKIDANFNGVYIISLCANPKETSALDEIDISKEAFNRWLKEAPDLEIDNIKVSSIEQVRYYLNKFWHKNENIIYIGESTSKTNPIEKRINQFYIHKVGQKGPHTGGYWVKLLSCLDDLYIYFAESSNPREMEFKMILRFAELLSGKNLFQISDLATSFPFANSKVDLFKKNTIKNHINSNKRTEKNGS